MRALEARRPPPRPGRGRNGGVAGGARPARGVTAGVSGIESPVQRTYTLGSFFDEWGQLLGSAQVGPAQGHVTAIYNGQVYQGNPRGIPLTAHAQIQLEVGTPLVAPESITWPSGL